MRETPEKQPQETPPSMNNFYAYLPGGWLREYYDESPEKHKLMDAIDQLLKDEFPQINGREIASIMIEINRSIIQALNKNESSTELKKQFKEAEEKLRPLFNRLLEMGFNIELMKG